MRKSNLDPRFIYITAPSVSILQQRLADRTFKPVEACEKSKKKAKGTGKVRLESDDERDVANWIQKAGAEELCGQECDFQLENNDFELTFSRLSAFCMESYFCDNNPEQAGILIS